MSAASAHGLLVRARSVMACARGSTAIEYALIASLIGLAIVGGLGATGNSVGGSVNLVMERVSAAISGN
ncbi:Flp family type IVb pilin [Aureimonas sp. AU12]|uniref:Flp family type IVb pilin n=1 Tax=Aureimonas sp. AU12 TaxID=1638161 RepID=UPI001FCCD17A|nr:Flp family type IVb pilin [Aureimonas sp. AU12]